MEVKNKSSGLQSETQRIPTMQWQRGLPSSRIPGSKPRRAASPPAVQGWGPELPAVPMWQLGTLLFCGVSLTHPSFGQHRSGKRGQVWVGASYSPISTPKGKLYSGTVPLGCPCPHHKPRSVLSPQHPAGSNNRLP